jgi:hypothetical protein
MQNLRFGGLAAAALMSAGVATSAVALEKTSVWACQDAGGSPPQPLGDREGHSIGMGQNSCRVESGTYAGGVSTDEGIWEWDGPKATELSGSGIVRKPGSTLAWKETEGETTLTMTDGKVTGWTSSGGGVNTLAIGDWASLAGKRYHWTAKSVGPASQFTVESTQE